MKIRSQRNKALLLHYSFFPFSISATFAVSECVTVQCKSNRRRIKKFNRITRILIKWILVKSINNFVRSWIFYSLCLCPLSIHSFYWLQTKYNYYNHRAINNSIWNCLITKTHIVLTLFISLERVLIYSYVSIVSISWTVRYQYSLKAIGGSAWGMSSGGGTGTAATVG